MPALYALAGSRIRWMAHSRMHAHVPPQIDQLRRLANRAHGCFEDALRLAREAVSQVKVGLVVPILAYVSRPLVPSRFPRQEHPEAVVEETPPAPRILDGAMRS